MSVRTMRFVTVSRGQIKSEAANSHTAMILLPTNLVEMFGMYATDHSAFVIDFFFYDRLFMRPKRKPMRVLIHFSIPEIAVSIANKRPNP